MGLTRSAYVVGMDDMLDFELNRYTRRLCLGRVRLVSRLKRQHYSVRRPRLTTFDEAEGGWMTKSCIRDR